MLQRGTVIFDADGNPVELEIEINKFSTFTIVSVSNTAPVASKLKITGKGKVGNKLTAAYTYSDADKDEQGSSIITWYRADDKNGKKKTLISEGSKLSYKITKKDQGKYIIVEVTPIAQTGNLKGETVRSVLKIAKVKKAPAATVVKVEEKEISYNSQVKLGVIGNKTFADEVALLFKQDYQTANVIVKEEGKYYRVYVDFVDKTAAKAAFEDLRTKGYRLNYYYYEK